MTGRQMVADGAACFPGRLQAGPDPSHTSHTSCSLPSIAIFSKAGLTPVQDCRDTSHSFHTFLERVLASPVLLVNL
jgi:hypothetical protein